MALQIKKLISYLKLKSKITNPYVNLFLASTLQVLLVAVNTYQLAHKKWIGCFIVGFAISFIWTFNVKRVSIGTMRDRIVYASGAAVGTLLGLALSIYIYEIAKI